MEAMLKSPNQLGRQKDEFSSKLINSPEQVSDREILDYLISTFLSRRHSRSVVEGLTERFGSFANIISADPRDLIEVPGLNVAGITTLRLVGLAAKRLLRGEISNRDILNSWDRLIDYLTADLSREQIENVRCLFLDGKYRLISAETLFTGTVRNTPVLPRQLIKRAIELNSIYLVIAHNHPTGDPTASQEDIETTLFLRYSLSLIGLELLDHIIIGNGVHMSFRNEGWFDCEVSMPGATIIKHRSTNFHATLERRVAGMAA